MTVTVHARGWKLVALLASCGCASLPSTHFYRVAVARDIPHAAAPIAGTLALQTLDADAAYSDDRIVYRKSAYKLDYYNYHRWVAPPALQLTDYLRDAYARSGWFQQVEVGAPPCSSAALSGRVLGFEEVDAAEARWLGRVEIELQLRALSGGTLLWSRRFVETQPAPKQSPEGVAMALSGALARIVRASARELAEAVARHTAAVGAAASCAAPPLAPEPQPQGAPADQGSARPQLR